MTATGTKTPALTYKIIAECKESKARTSLMTLPHCAVETPVFMPVGTKGSLKGLLPDQLEAMDCRILLGNTYHLGTNPGPELLKKAGGLHKFMGWDRAILTDSGGFQMVSLLSLAEIKEEGVQFKSPYDDSSCLLSPENSIQIQNSIGADIIMQLDDVVSSLTTGPRVEEAMERTIRWLDRCINAHERDDDQNIFPIVQGGLDDDLRKRCVAELVKRNVRGFAVGGISGGEAKDDFWRVVKLCSDLLPKDKPRYCMGVGFAADLVVCVALGIDMFDCVFPTRTARFGCGLVETGQINLKHRKFAKDLRPVQEGCECSTCRTYTRAYIHSIVTVETVACNLLSVHNVYYQLKLMKDIRESIKEERFPEFVQLFMKKMFEDREVPKWIKDALAAVNIKLP
ncbi:unnamed protein product [Nezara viridula]|uniref:Queuine tRNA-ribosyltransferase catalytic subunit 1 n=1 Tax=Nezara viridula TaxID=85310 RepID=A0A9P0E6R7_NEZVI|nr:unnamed protein product [Nezara viridula]